MDLVQAVILAFVQGLTEFLPISSSGHLVLVPKFLGWPDQGLAFDVAVHLGTLAAVLAYFRRDLVPMGRDWLASLGGRPRTPEARLAWWVIWGTVPVVAIGGLAADAIEAGLRSPQVIAVTTAGFGVLLWLADARGARARDEYSLGWADALLIGLAQATALVPGVSRSGITMTAALLLGLDRQAAARFSFLLSIPVIVAAGVLETSVLLGRDEPVDWTLLAVGTVVSGVVAYLTIRAFLALLGRIGMAPFAVYRLLLGALIFWAFA